MKAKNIFITLAAAFTFSLTGVAQTARQILDQTAAKLKNSGGIEAVFEGTTFNGTAESGHTTGNIAVQNNKFRIKTDGLTTWFDGKTQWTLLDGSDEVNVNTPTPSEISGLNPYAFIDLYKKGYVLKLAPFTYNGRAAHEVRLQAAGKTGNIRLMILVIDKQSGMPLSIRVKDNAGKWTRIRIQSIKTHRKWNDSYFRFVEKEHPGIEVIDLR